MEHVKGEVGKRLDSVSGRAWKKRIGAGSKQTCFGIQFAKEGLPAPIIFGVFGDNRRSHRLLNAKQDPSY
jgi:hypothetical protein